MSEAGDLLQLGQKEIGEVVLGGQTVELRTKTYPCTINTLRIEHPLEVGGFADDTRIGFSLRKSAFTPVTGDNSETPTGDSDIPYGDIAERGPRVGDVVRLNQREYKIVAVNEDSAGAFWRCDCDSINK